MAAQATSVTLANTVTTYPGTAQVIVPFIVRRWTVAAKNTDGTGLVFFSLDGINDHGVFSPGIVAGVAGQQVSFQSGTKLWLRCTGVTPASSAVTVTAEDTAPA